MKVLVTACLFWSFIVLPVDADIIYFKDGMRSICQEKAWEKGNEIKCEYEGWVISYQKKDVLRIEKTIPEKGAAPPDGDNSGTDNTAKNKVSKVKSPSAPTGQIFYDPRRPFKYWTGNDSKHKSYQEAIQALADQYKRPSKWIQTNMGGSNDLMQIHQNLANSDSDLNTPAAELPAGKPTGIAFYNPRRKFPYRTGKDAKHKSYKQAIQALAQKYEQSPEWVQANMGMSNDLNEINQKLSAGSGIK